MEIDSSVRESGTLLLLNHYPSADVTSLEEAVFKASKSSKNYKHIMAEIHCLVAHDNKTAKEVLEIVQSGQTEWKHPKFSDIAHTQNEIFSYIENPFEVIDGMFACPKCGNKKTVAYSKQTRSSDEGMSTFVFCTNRMCKHQWMYRG